MWYWNHKFWVITIAIVSLVQCKQKETEQVPETVAVEIPSDFVDFYKQFHDDTAYQINHIQFPLEGIPSLQPGDDISGMKWWFEKDGWKYHKPFNDANGTYQRNFENFGGMIIERIVDNSGSFDMQRRFVKSDSTWMLIYYKAMGPIIGAKE